MRRAAIGIGCFLILLISCNKVQLPIETSWGNLVRIEKVDRLITDEETLSPGTGEVLYLLSLEGKGKIAVQSSEPHGWMPPLVDSTGKQWFPVFAGSPTREGTLTKKQWVYNGQMTGQDGKLVFEGTISLPEPKMALVYLVPRSAAGLALKDGERRHRIL